MEEVLVLALHVELLALVLTQAIESLVVRTVEEGMPRPSVLLSLWHLGDVNTHLTVWHSEWLESLTALCHLIQEHIAFVVVEGDMTSSLVEHGTHGRGCDDEVVALLFHLILSLTLLRNDDEALLVAETLLCGSLDTDNLVADYLKTNLTRSLVLMLFQLHSKTIALLRESCCLCACGTQEQNC